MNIRFFVQDVTQEMDDATLDALGNEQFLGSIRNTGE